MPEKQNGARSVTTNQEGPYKELERVVRKHAATLFLRPVADHTCEAFATAKEFIDRFYRSASPSKPFDVVLDSGCGTGESTVHIAKRFPDTPVIGVDKSAARLTRACAGNAPAADGEIPPNAFWVRAELLDFWKLALDEVNGGRWHIPYHALYYPNPWPKQSEATRRFHLHPIFPTLIKLGEQIELRTNWEIYAREFAEAAGIVKAGAEIACESFTPEVCETAFERKYKEARQQLWRVLIGK
jgi:tRNA G46 methylase TrmB